MLITLHHSSKKSIWVIWTTLKFTKVGFSSLLCSLRSPIVRKYIVKSCWGMPRRWFDNSMPGWERFILVQEHFKLHYTKQLSLVHYYRWELFLYNGIFFYIFKWKHDLINLLQLPVILTFYSWVLDILP